MQRLGYKKSAIDRTLVSGVLRGVEHGVFLHGSADPTWHQRVVAGVARGGDRAKATAQTALVFHGVIESTDVVAFVVPFENRLALRGADVIRTRRELTRCRVLDDVPVVSVERALLDAASLVDRVALELLVETALLKNKTTEVRLWTALVEQGGRGVPGSANFRHVLEHRPNGRPARSILEVLAGHALVRHGVTGFVRNHAVVLGDGNYELDFAFVAQRVVLEVDGKAFHSTASQVGRDRVRQRALEEAGWRFLRVSWFDVVLQPDWVIDQLRALLAA